MLRWTGRFPLLVFLALASVESGARAPLSPTREVKDVRVWSLCVRRCAGRTVAGVPARKLRFGRPARGRCISRPGMLFCVFGNCSCCCNENAHFLAPLLHQHAKRRPSGQQTRNHPSKPDGVRSSPRCYLSPRDRLSTSSGSPQEALILPSCCCPVCFFRDMKIYRSKNCFCFFAHRTFLLAGRHQYRRRW